MPTIVPKYLSGQTVKNHIATGRCNYNKFDVELLVYQKINYLCAVA